MTMCTVYMFSSFTPKGVRVLRRPHRKVSECSGAPTERCPSTPKVPKNWAWTHGRLSVLKGGPINQTLLAQASPSDAFRCERRPGPFGVFGAAFLLQKRPMGQFLRGQLEGAPGGRRPPGPSSCHQKLTPSDVFGLKASDRRSFRTLQVPKTAIGRF